MMTNNSPKTARHTAFEESTIKRSPLTHWIHSLLGQSRIGVKVRLRGNNLHILCEGNYCPDADAIVQRFQQAMATTSLAQLLPPGAPEIHRVILYGRILGHAEPIWARAIRLTYRQSTAPAQSSTEVASAVSPVEATTAASDHSNSSNDHSNSSNDQSNQSNDNRSPQAAGQPGETAISLARNGQPDAIARYLSNALSALGIAVRAKVKPLDEATTGYKRLLIVCESAYTPDLSLLAQPITQQLRELELKQFRDAIVFGQVTGEERPEWRVRVDLTPPDEILQQWARWGDVQAITRLLNRALAPEQVELSALLKDTTLHLSCTSTVASVPDKLMAIAAVAPMLQALSPQGIGAAAIYGINAAATAPEATPAWVYWLTLASTAAEPVSTLDLARQGDLPALTFLLVRLLNPELDAALATGGIHVQIRQKGDLLHVMTDAPNCPRQDAIAPAVVRFLKPLHIASVSGVRMYGRRSGQKQPLWNYGIDFVVRNRLASEATPEFAASDAHVDELLSPPGAIVLWSDEPEAERSWSLKRVSGRVLEGVQRSFIRTQLFIPTDTPGLNPSLASGAPQPAQQRLKIALLWGAIGALLMLQTDWLLGYWMQISQQTMPPTQVTVAPITPSPTASSPTAQLSTTAPPNLSLNKNKAEGGGFNTSSFTQSGKTVLVPTESDRSNTNPLPASPLQAKAETVMRQTDAPSFNSRQLDGQLELYRRYLEINGAPDVLIIGSSRALRGVDPAALEAALAEQGYAGVQVFNFGVNGATAQVVDLIIRQMLPQDKLPKLMIFADGARAFNSGRTDITYNGIVASEGYRSLLAGNPPIPSTIAAQVPNDQPKAQNGQPASTAEETSAVTANRYQQLNEELNRRVAALSTIYAERDRLKTRLREQFAALVPGSLSSSADVIATSDSLINSSPSASAATGGTIADNGQDMLDIDGFLPLSVQFNPTTYYQKYARVSGDYDSDYEAFELQGTQTDALLAIAQYAKSRQVPIVFVNLPLTGQYLDPVRKRHEEAFQQHMLSLAPQSGFIYRDLSGALTTQPRYFSDPSHLNRFGAYEVSRRLAQDVMIPWQMAR